MIETGQEAPDFELRDQDGETVTLSGLRGRRVVLYFYPKADTPGCTTQACGIRDRGSEYGDAGAVVLGVSPDPVKAVKKFHDKQALNFTLLADEDHAVCETYGVWAEKSMYGKTYWGALRATFIIDGELVNARLHLPSGARALRSRAWPQGRRSGTGCPGRTAPGGRH